MIAASLSLSDTANHSSLINFFEDGSRGILFCDLIVGFFVIIFHERAIFLLCNCQEPFRFMFFLFPLNNAAYDESNDPASDVVPKLLGDFDFLALSDVSPNLALVWISTENEGETAHNKVGTDE